MNRDLQTLDFDRILVRLQEEAVSQAARERLAGLEPSTDETRCRALMDDTTAARAVLDAEGAPPLALMDSLEESLILARQGAMLTPEQLYGVARFSATVRALRRYLERSETVSPVIASWRCELPELTGLEDEIDRCVSEDQVRDEASPLLRSLRRKVETAAQAIREKLEQVLRTRKSYLADSYITQRNGRYVVPVQKKWQAAFGGVVVDASGKGGTLFMEPGTVIPLREEKEALEIEADAEERRVLYELSDAVAAREEEIRKAGRAMVELDMLFAKAKLSASMDARPVTLTPGRRVMIREGRHPLLEKSACVPLNLVLEGEVCGVAITGPNTGGKTVCMKTVGLFCAMAQCGLHLPCGEGTEIGLTDGVYCDVGDSQSIAQNLSTFSGHMTNVIRILTVASVDSLVVLDELGGGTDPMEGSGIAIAVLEELLRRKCRFLVTTHDPQVKRWAGETPGVASARMAFDRETLRPLYRLEQGIAGESCALEIVRRLGLPAHLTARARAVVYGEKPSSAKPCPPPRSRLTRTPPPKSAHAPAFSMGDSVELLPDKLHGIVYRPADKTGLCIVQVQGEKRTVRENRLRLLVPATELYPPDYDFSIIFDTVSNRKAAHQMERKFSPEARIVHEGT